MPFPVPPQEVRLARLGTFLNASGQVEDAGLVNPGGGSGAELIGPVPIDDTTGSVDLSGIEPLASLAVGTLVLDMWAVVTTDPTTPAGGDTLEMRLETDDLAGVAVLRTYDLGNTVYGLGAWFDAEAIVAFPASAHSVIRGAAHLASDLAGTGVGGGAWDVYALVIRP